MADGVYVLPCGYGCMFETWERPSLPVRACRVAVSIVNGVQVYCMHVGLRVSALRVLGVYRTGV